MPNNTPPEFIQSLKRFPTSKHDYTLVTPMMEDAYDIVVNEVENMETGICMYSTSRFGKTRALKYISNRMKLEMPSVSIANIIMTTTRIQSENHFFSHFMEAIAWEDYTGGSAKELRSQIEQVCLVMCSEKHDPRILIVIDEAQRIVPRNYSYLIDLTNHLERLGMAPIVFLVGQPELVENRNTLLQDKRRDVVGRFLEDPIQFEGVRSLEVLTKILIQYDDFTVASYPEKSKTCITAAYVGNLFSKGFRLQKVAPILWQSIENTSRTLLVNQDNPTIGMKSLVKAIEIGLTELAITQHSENSLEEMWWQKILRTAAYLKHMTTISPTAH